MSAERLRDAASLMREQHGPEHERHEMWAAMATWVEVTADAYEGWCDSLRGQATIVPPRFSAPLRVATAYLAAAAAPETSESTTKERSDGNH